MTIFDYILLSCTVFVLIMTIIEPFTRSPFEKALIASGMVKVELTLFSKLVLFVFPLIVAYRLWG